VIFFIWKANETGHTYNEPFDSHFFLLSKQRLLHD